MLTDSLANIDRFNNYYQDLQDCFNDQMLNVKNIIVMDIKRTYSKFTSQSTKDKMLRILYSYAKRNMDMGYCQGLNYICYYLLNFGFTEERVFWMLAYLVENLIPKGYYSTMVAVIADIRLFKYILKIKSPKLMKHFQKLSIDLNFFILSWFITIFTNIKNLYVV